MGFLDKIFKSNFPEDDDDEYEDDTEEADEEEAPAVEPTPVREAEPTAPKAGVKAAPKAAPAPAVATPTATGSKVNINGTSIELKVVKPDNFSVVSQIADHLLNRRTVVLNLETTSKEDKRRIIDFLSGVAYSINGRLSKVAANTYLIVPANVSVSGVTFDEGSGEGGEGADSDAPKRVNDIYED